MANKYARRLVGPIFCGGLVGLLGAFSQSTPPHKLECLSATQWVVAHAEALPSSYVDLSALPISVRRKVFSALSVPQRAELWHAHFAAFEATHKLSAEQRAFLDEITASVEQSMMVRDVSRDSLTRVRGIALFGKQLAFELMANLGPAPAQATKVDEQLPCECDANEGDHQNWCFGSNKCKWGGCIYDSWGCGLYWAWPCSGCCSGSCGYI